MEKISNSRVLKASIVYILVSFINKGIGIITVPVFTRLLTTAEMGVVSTFISWLTMLSPVTSLSLVSGSICIAMNEFKDKRDQYESSILCLSTISSFVCLVIYFMLKDFLNPIFTLPSYLVCFMFVYLIFAPALEMWMVRQRYEYNVRTMALVTLASNLSASIVSIFLVVCFRNDYFGAGDLRIFGTYITTGIFAIFFYFFILKNGKVFYNREFWSFGIKLSIPLMFHTLAKNILDVSDRTMISIYCSKGDVGIYGTIYSISALSLIVWTSINNAFVPVLFDKLDSYDIKDKKEVAQLSYIMITIFAAVSVCMTLVAPEIVRVMTTAEYYEAVYIIPPIAAGIFLTCVYNLFANVILYHKKTVIIMGATTIAALLNIILNAIFIPIYGYQAASYTTLIAFIMLSVTQGIAMRIVHKEKLYNMGIIALISSIVIVACVLCNLLYNTFLLRYLIIFIMILVAFCYRKKLLGLIKRVKNRGV